MKKLIVLLTLLMSFVLHAADNKSAVVSDKQTTELEECTAEKPIKGILNPKYKGYTNFTTSINKYDISESAVFYKLMEINVTHGGCAHYAYTFKYTLYDSHLVADKKHYLNKAINLLAQTEMVQDYKSIPKEISKHLKENINNSNVLQEGRIVVSLGYRHIYFNFLRAADNKVIIEIIDDTAL